MEENQHKDTVHENNTQTPSTPINEHPSKDKVIEIDAKDKEQQKYEEIIANVHDLPTPSLKTKVFYLGNNLRNQHKLITNEVDKLNKDMHRKSTFVFGKNFNKIRSIINGETSLKDLTFTEDELNAYKLTNDDSVDKRIPYFWRIALVNATFFEINEKDKQILDHLIDVKINETEETYPNWSIEFVFEENEYLDGNVLIKEFICDKDDVDKVVSTKASELKWKDDDKNPMKKIVKKVVKKKKTQKTITKEKKVKSFFDFFKTIEKVEDKDKKNDTKDNNNSDDSGDEENTDTKSPSDEANFIRNDFIPNCLEYFLNIMTIDFDEIDDDTE